MQVNNSAGQEAEGLGGARGPKSPLDPTSQAHHLGQTEAVRRLTLLRGRDGPRSHYSLAIIVFIIYNSAIIIVLLYNLAIIRARRHQPRVCPHACLFSGVMVTLGCLLHA